MDKSNICIRGGEATAKVLKTILANGIRVNGMCFADNPEYEFGFGTKLALTEPDLVGYCDKGYFTKQGYTLVTPWDFLKAWCPEECPGPEEFISNLVNQEFNIKVIL
jgi:hypothetical protein